MAEYPAPDTSEYPRPRNDFPLRDDLEYTGLTEKQQAAIEAAQQEYADNGNNLSQTQEEDCVISLYDLCIDDGNGNIGPLYIMSVDPDTGELTEYRYKRANYGGE